MVGEDISILRQSFLSCNHVEAVLGNCMFNADEGSLEKFTVGLVLPPFSSIALRQALHPPITTSRTCINGLCLFAMFVFPRLVKSLSDYNYENTACYRIFDILRWRLCRTSSVKSSYMSGNMLCILRPTSSQNNFRSKRESTDISSSAAQTKSRHLLL